MASTTTTSDTYSKRDKARVWQWADVKDAVEEHGRIMFLYKESVYDVTAWAKTHPGGELALRHLNGKDATDVMRVFHPPSVVKQRLPHFLAGVLHPSAVATMSSPPLIVDPSLYPDAETYDASPIKPILDHPELAPKGNYISTMDHPEGVPLESQAFIKHTEQVLIKYRALDETLRARGLYTTRMSLYWLNLVKFFVLLGTALYLVVGVISPALSGAAAPLSPLALWTATLTAAVLMGMFWHQNAFVAHDAGHISVTANYTADWYLGWILGNVTGGISIGWWKKSHNVHHIITNHPEHDPDIQHLPVFAVTPLFFQNMWSSFHKKTMVFDVFARAFVSVQHYAYYPIMMVARFNLYAQSVIYLLTDRDTNKHPRIELAGLVIFWTWFGYLLSYLRPHFGVLFTFLMVSHAVTFLLHLQITLSHFAMSVHEVSPNEAFPSRQLRTTMDVDCPTWLDWFHGGLQFQAVHHLFPRLPRTSFRAARPLVEQFARETGLVYTLVPFIEGNGMVLANFREVARQMKIVFHNKAE
ncbi:fatty acid desaturase-domain-containing protein [Blastocladiella britannica]|nr:fatty acid desaturase-domain-containing protein [Blastocladiella britannica]